jgi:hypothetical protein
MAILSDWLKLMSYHLRRQRRHRTLANQSLAKKYSIRPMVQPGKWLHHCGGASFFL